MVANAFKHVASYYPLELEFLLKAKPKDEWLSVVTGRIKDVHDKKALDPAIDSGAGDQGD